MRIPAKRFARLALLLISLGVVVVYCYQPRPADPYEEWAQLRASRRGEIIGGARRADGVILAQVVGPNRPTENTRIPDDNPNAVKYFWVTLMIVGVHDDFGQELKGKTIQLQTEAFAPKWVGRTLPLRLWFVRGGGVGNGGIEYSLPCSSLSLANMLAQTPSTRIYE